MKKLDFIMNYLQPPIQVPIYMDIIQGLFVNKKYKHVLYLNKNLYGQKQAGKFWYDYLSKILIKKLYMKRIQHDECLL